VAGITVKNLFELKNAKRVTVRNNIMENCWLQAQGGYALVLTIRSENSLLPWATIEDVVIENNVISHLGAGINILAHEDGGRLSGRMANVAIRRNQFLDVNPTVWGGYGRQVQIINGPVNLELADNTFEGAGLNSTLQFVKASGSPVPELLCEGFKFTGNRIHEGLYGVIGEGCALGTPSLNAYAPNYVWANNTILRTKYTNNIPYPTGTTIVNV
jgi:hypothetical protein